MVDQVTFQTLFQFLQTVGILVGVFYYIMTLQNTRKSQQMQLETRQAQLFWNAIDKFTSKEGLDNIKILNYAAWSNHEEWLEKYRNDVEYNGAFMWLKDIFEGIGVSLRLGYLDIKLLAHYNTQSTIYWWEKYRDLIYNERGRRNDRRWHSEWEYLYDELMKYLEEHPELSPY